MERLTEYWENEEEILGAIITKCEGTTCEDICKNYFPDVCNIECPIRKAIEKLAEYEDLEEQGKLPKLPCAVGDTVYEVWEGFIEPCTVEVIFIADYKDKEGEFFLYGRNSL